jgi:hypothetical protein
MQADLLRADASARVRLRRQRACTPALSYTADCWHEDDWVDKAGARFTCFTGTKVRILTVGGQSRCAIYLLSWYKSTNSDWVDKADWSDQGGNRCLVALDEWGYRVLIR